MRHFDFFLEWSPAPFASSLSDTSIDLDAIVELFECAQLGKAMVRRIVAVVDLLVFGETTDYALHTSIGVQV